MDAFFQVDVFTLIPGRRVNRIVNQTDENFECASQFQQDMLLGIGTL
jgi:hypothetical protein